MYIIMYIISCIYGYIYMDIYIYGYMDIYGYLWIYIYGYVDIYGYIYIYIYIDCIHIYIYIKIHWFRSFLTRQDLLCYKKHKRGVANSIGLKIKV